MIHWWKILSFENEFGKGRDIRSGPPVDFFLPFLHMSLPWQILDISLKMQIQM